MVKNGIECACILEDDAMLLATFSTAPHFYFELTIVA